jgi:hypothetical protein
VPYDWPFDARFLLVSKHFGANTLSVRRDDFNVGGAGSQHGRGWTAAYALEPNKHWRFILEWLRVRTDIATESKVELGVRYAISLH